MQLSQARVTAFIDACERELGLTLSPDDAETELAGLVAFLRALFALA